jgi:hypothetical protein
MTVDGMDENRLNDFRPRFISENMCEKSWVILAEGGRPRSSSAIRQTRAFRPWLKWPSHTPFEKSDHCTGVQNAVHRRSSSLEISRCLPAAKAVLLVRTWIYFLRTWLTSFSRQEEDGFESLEGPHSVLMTGL